jgi:hypothetical protein
VDAKKYKYKGVVQRRIPMMDSASIYGYICISIVGSSLIGMIVFAWIVLAMLSRVPQR